MAPASGDALKFSFSLGDMDYGDLAAKFKLIPIDEMRHAEMST